MASGSVVADKTLSGYPDTYCVSPINEHSAAHGRGQRTLASFEYENDPRKVAALSGWANQRPRQIASRASTQ